MADEKWILSLRDALEGLSLKGWSLEQQSDHCLLQRECAVLRYNQVNLPPFIGDRFEDYIRKRGRPRKLTIRLWAEAAMTLEDVEALGERNRALSREIQALREHFELKGIARKFDDYAPTNEKERSQVKSYEAEKRVLSAKRRRLPFARNKQWTLYLDDQRHFTDGYWYEKDDLGLKLEEVKDCLKNEFHDGD